MTFGLSLFALPTGNKDKPNVKVDYNGAVTKGNNTSIMPISQLYTLTNHRHYFPGNMARPPVGFSPDIGNTKCSQHEHCQYTFTTADTLRYDFYYSHRSKLHSRQEWQPTCKNTSSQKAAKQPPNRKFLKNC